MNSCRTFFLICFWLTVSNLTLAQRSDNAQQTTNIAAFAKLYGYVRYFHPSDEASKIIWMDFLWYGINEVREAKDNEELLKRLNQLFAPIAPSVRVFKTGTTEVFSPAMITPANAQKYRVIAWQHLGYGFGGNQNYLSRRTNRAFIEPTLRIGKVKRGYNKQLFERMPVVGDFIEKPLGGGLTCRVPLALYGNESVTFPSADQTVYNAFRKSIDGTVQRAWVPGTASGSLERVTAVIFSWNVLKHFYPYREQIGAEWDQQLVRGISVALDDPDVLKPIQLLTGALADGHAQIIAFNNAVPRTVPLKLRQTGGKLMIVKVDTSLSASGIVPGDLLLEINGRTASDVLDSIKETISGTPQWKDYVAVRQFLDGPENTIAKLKVQSGAIAKTAELKRSAPVAPQDFVEEPSREILPGIYYLNINNTPMKEIRKKLPDLAKAKGIICDLRGYPDSNEDFLLHLLQTPDTSRNFYTPEIIYPDFEKVSWQREGWELKPASPHLGAKVVFLADGRSISYAESYLGVVKSYKLGTIIGQPTAGANGDVNSFTVPASNIRVIFTGLVATQPNGDRLQGVGIQPDIIVKPTLIGLREGRDELLEKAVELVKK